MSFCLLKFGRISLPFLFFALISSQLLGERLTRVKFGRTGGVVSNIADTGDIAIDNGQTIIPWGLEIKDQEIARNLLIGKKIGCYILDGADDVYIADCFVFPELTEQLQGEIGKDLFDTLVENSAYTPTCSEREVAISGIMQASGFVYNCSHELGPQRIVR